MLFFKATANEKLANIDLRNLILSLTFLSSEKECRIFKDLFLAVHNHHEIVQVLHFKSALEFAILIADLDFAWHFLKLEFRRFDGNFEPLFDYHPVDTAPNAGLKRVNLFLQLICK